MTPDDRDVRRHWEANADAWTSLSRDGYDVYRDALNTPAFLAMLPDIAGLDGLDLGCGEGHNTRLLATRGAHMTALDVSATFLRHAQQVERNDATGVRYVHGTAASLPFRDGAFAFATAFMSLMDMADLDAVLREVRRVLRPGGFLQASIEHPCFTTPHRRKVRGDDGRTRAVEVGDYFRQLDGDVQEWTFTAAPPDRRAGVAPFRIPRFSRPLSAWINLLVDAGLTIERLAEPRPSDADVARVPKLEDAQTVAYFLHLRVRRQ
jgi:SAM-dependent methyltransferase